MKNFYSPIIRNTSFLFLMLTAFAKSYAQDLPKLSQYMFNKQVFNPAAVGTSDATLNASVLYRMQWMGVEGAPQSLVAWGDYKFTKKRMALGLNLNRTSYAIFKNTDFQANYAYQVPLTKKLKLSMGLRAGMSSTAVGSDLTRVWDQNDPYINYLNTSATYMKIGAGLHLFSSKFYAGFSVPDLYAKKNIFTYSTKDKNYITYAGGSIRLNDTYRLLPSMICYLNPATKSRIDASLLVEIKDYVWGGVTVSTRGQYVITAGSYISPRLRLSYGYEISKPGTTGSISCHELNLRFAVDNLFKK